MKGRLASLDALRGFDMLWIIGGAEIVRALAEATGLAPLSWIAAQTHHTEWNGFRLWDLVFPLFLFLAGVSMPFSMEHRIARGDGRRALHAHVLKRACALVFLGIVYNGLLTFDFAHQRYASVLGRIGLAWAGAALIFLHTDVRGQVAWAVGLLVAYWLAMVWIPVPGIGAGDLGPGRNLADFLDQHLLPGRLHRGNRDPEGILATVPAVSTALLGVLTGHWLRTARSEASKVIGMLAAGVVLCGLGLAWHPVFPINKNLWTSSFACLCAGLSLLSLALFYYVIDVRGHRGAAFFLVVVGTNAITVYLLHDFVDWKALADLALVERHVHPIVSLAAALGLQWALLLVLYRRRIFLRV